MLGTVVDGRWQPGIGDPSLLGWSTVLAYLLAAWLCWRAAGAKPMDAACPPHTRRARRFWWVMAALLLALAVNKQLDLQSWLTQEARQWAKASGWYARKQQLQRAFVVGLAASAAAGLAAAAWLTRRAGWGTRTALLGGVFLLAFILVRASSFHHVDRWLGLSTGPASRNALLELSGIACVAAGALLHRRRCPSPPDHPSRTP